MSGTQRPSPSATADPTPGLVPEPVFEGTGKSSIGVLSVGSCDGAVREAMQTLGKEGVAADYCRVKAFPFSASVGEFIEQHDVVYVIEQNRDAQLRSLLILDIEADQDKLVSVLHYNGLPMTATFVVSKIQEHMSKGRAA